MARQITTSIWCDICLSEGVNTPGEETPHITIGNMKPRVVALCPGQHMKVYEEFKALVAELGQATDAVMGVRAHKRPATPTATAPTTGKGSGTGPSPRDDRDVPGALICPMPECGVGKVARSSLRDHARRDHDLPLAVLEARYGNGLSVEGLELTWDCPYCEAKFTHGAGRAAHVKNDHPDQREDWRANHVGGGPQR